ncbi:MULTISPECIES: APC family permease [Cetobacterium]|jgi:amino acid transporter|uniref:APC family permease n=1 Tax=Candidatus Cetobacterium colombiensis TaxID=3073100 RepID=A0ABU4WCL6_9FUSO|nr:APC family permease [Candidatus Cetobacterium colombiensis]MDX8337256.1 APC family permease [Candidatus Cetobacterium colombiensis]
MKNKLGFWSIVLLGINSIIGSGIFLLPNKAYSLVGVGSIFVILFDMILVLSIALCFAEASGMFKKNGGPYVYAKEAFGEFVGFEVGFMKWAIAIIAWAAMAAGFVQALSDVWAPAQDPIVKNTIISILIIGLGIINILGVKVSKILNNIITLGKLIPLIIFIAIGIFFIKGDNFVPFNFLNSTEKMNFAPAALLMFYAFTGFESIAVAAEDMNNPEKDLPIATIAVMLIVSIFYILILIVSIGVLGKDLSISLTPIAQAAGNFMGETGAILITAGTLISIGGINIAASFVTPRCGVALAEDGILPRVIAKNGRFGTPTTAIIITVILALLIAISGSFVKLAAISVISRFVQYLPTCLAIPVLRKKRPDLARTFKVPLGPVIPIFAIVVSCWLVYNSDMEKILIGLGGLILGVPIYFFMKKYSK